MSARIEIGDRLGENLARVRHLIELYAREAPSQRGRRSVELSDLLRASVVFIHATLEDLLRTVLLAHWPECSESLLFEGVSLLGDRKKEKFKLSDLLAHRERSVDSLIRESIAIHLDHSNFNDVGEVKLALVRSGLDPSLADPVASDLAAMMSRRHWIVHRADRNEKDGPGQQSARSLSLATVEVWYAAIQKFGSTVIAHL